MKFFIPSIPDDEAENFLKTSIVPFLELQGFRITHNRRIFSIAFRHNGETTTDVVGQYSSTINEPVFVILETDNLYLVCTTNRGILGGEPMLIDKDMVKSVNYFDNSYKYLDWTYMLEHNNHEVISPLDPPKTLFKYYHNSKNSRSAIENKYLFCSHPYQLNDSMDCSNTLWDFSKLTSQRYDSFLNHYKDTPFLKNKVSYDEDKERGFNFIKSAFWNISTNQTGIISMSEKPLHTLMWSHYASEKGFMIELDRIKLIGDLKSLNHNIRNYVFMPIQYVDDLERIDFFSPNFISPDIPFLYSINIKRNDWSYEHEWRLVCYTESFGIPYSITLPEADLKGESERKVYYSKDTLISMTLGKNFFNGSNLKETIYPHIYVMKGGEDLDFVNFLYNNYNDRLYISDEDEEGKKFLRRRKRVKFEKLDESTFKVKTLLI